MDGYYGNRGVEEHFWMNSQGGGRPSEVTYRGSYSTNMDGEHYFQSAMVMCFAYILARMFFNGMVGLLLVGLFLVLIMQLLDSASASLRPRADYSRRRMF